MGERKQREDEREWLIDVTADKPGRQVRVDMAWGSRRVPETQELERTHMGLTLGIEPPIDPWTWLTPDEARAVADALHEAADELDSRAD